MCEDVALLALFLIAGVAVAESLVALVESLIKGRSDDGV